MSTYKRVQQWMTFARVWHVFDARWQNPFESAKVIQKYLSGLNKPICGVADCGDHVVVINSKHIALPGNEWTRRVFFHHTGYPGGASWTLAWEVHQRDPTMVMRRAVYGSMRGNLQRRYKMELLHIFPDDKIPEDIAANITNQIRPLRPIPKRLDFYTPEEIEKFPKIVDYPKDYVIR